MAGEKAAQIFAWFAVGEISTQHTFDSFWNLSCGTAISDRARDGLIQSEGSSQAEVIGVHHVSVDFYLLAFDSYVSNPVLPATVGATGDVKFQVLIKPRKTVFQILDQPSREALGFGDGELAELRTAASHGTPPERRPADRKSDLAQFLRQLVSLQPRYIDDDKILHVGGAQLTEGEAFCQIGRSFHLLGRDSAPQNRGSHVAKARLLLRMNTDVIAIDIRRRVFGFGRIEMKSETALKFTLEVLRCPTMAQKKKL